MHTVAMDKPSPQKPPILQCKQDISKSLLLVFNLQGFALLKYYTDKTFIIHREIIILESEQISYLK